MKQVDPASASPAAHSASSKAVITVTSCTVWEPVGSSSSTAMRRPVPAWQARILSRAPASTRAGGAAAITSAADRTWVSAEGLGMGAPLSAPETGTRLTGQPLSPLSAWTYGRRTAWAAGRTSPGVTMLGSTSLQLVGCGSDHHAEQGGDAEGGASHDRFQHGPGLEGVLLTDPEVPADQPVAGVVDVRGGGGS